MAKVDVLKSKMSPRRKEKGNTQVDNQKNKKKLVQGLQAYMRKYNRQITSRYGSWANETCPQSAHWEEESSQDSMCVCVCVKDIRREKKKTHLITKVALDVSHGTNKSDCFLYYQFSYFDQSFFFPPSCGASVLLYTIGFLLSTPTVQLSRFDAAEWNVRNVVV